MRNAPLTLLTKRSDTPLPHRRMITVRIPTTNHKCITDSSSAAGEFM
jgi:hypothetical protein